MTPIPWGWYHVMMIHLYLPGRRFSWIRKRLAGWSTSARKTCSDSEPIRFYTNLKPFVKIVLTVVIYNILSLCLTSLLLDAQKGSDTTFHWLNLYKTVTWANSISLNFRRQLLRQGLYEKPVHEFCIGVPIGSHGSLFGAIGTRFVFPALE